MMNLPKKRSSCLIRQPVVMLGVLKLTGRHFLLQTPHKLNASSGAVKMRNKLRRSDVQAKSVAWKTLTDLPYMSYA